MPRSLLLLFVILCVSQIAVGLIPIDKLQEAIFGKEALQHIKRASADEEKCAKISCVKPGNACIGPGSKPCSRCSDDFINCTTNAYTEGATNKTKGAEAACICFLEAIACAEDAPASELCENSDYAYVLSCDTAFHSSPLNATNVTCPCPDPSTFDRKTSVCDRASACDNTTNKCASLKTSGSCYFDSQCGNPDSYFDFTEYICNSTQCTTTRFASIGDGCTKDGDCLGTKATCTGGVCTGGSAGKPCLSVEDCDFDNYCKAGTCAALLAAGAACTPVDMCVHDYYCGPEDKCVKPFTKAVGETCEITSECKRETFCKEGKCATPIAIPTCTTTSDCESYHEYSTCECQLDGSKRCTEVNSNPTTCDTETDALDQCLFDNKCKGGVSKAPTSCAERHCADKFNCALNCAQEKTDIFEMLIARGCMEKKVFTCSTDSGAPPANGITFTSVILAALFAVLFLVS